ncbi:MAG: hypothetical protein ACNA8P_13210, partial [Phycisphaerales bacterium]
MTTAPMPHHLQALLALGQSRRPWEYLRAVADAETESRSLPPVRFLLAANLGSLGLCAPALEILGELDRSSAAGLNTAPLREALTTRPDNRLSADQQRDTLAGNLAHLESPTALELPGLPV